jgi:hypothetical protein
LSSLTDLVSQRDTEEREEISYEWQAFALQTESDVREREITQDEQNYLRQQGVGETMWQYWKLLNEV